MNAALRALNRFGLGARVGEPESLRDPRGWLLAQLESGDPVWTEPGLPSLAEAGAALRAQRQSAADPDPERRRAGLAQVQAIRRAEVSASLGQRIATDAPFVERLVAFWSNHLCVSLAGGPQLGPLAGHYERTVVRPHTLGRFSDMVLASARHPAMLFYLDNVQSIGPSSSQARAAVRRRGRVRGLNENYARELLELHTLGVEGGYTQSDVENLAKVLTGWTVGGVGPALAEPFGFVFRDALHEPGSKTVLGRSYEGRGQADGEAVIQDLCAHPSTARFVATKLVTHFVSDAPPATAVDRIADTFRATDGDLRAVASALVTGVEAWEPDSRKIRAPQDWVVAMVRALGVREIPPPMVQGLNDLRHPVWAPPSPRGFGDLVRDWADPDGLMNRAELARSVVGRLGRNAPDPAHLAGVIEITADDPLHMLLADRSIAPEERAALAFGGPAFQWR